jgi:hypothetical protein
MKLRSFTLMMALVLVAIVLFPMAARASTFITEISDVEIEPGGSIRSTSSAVTFRSNAGTVICAMTLSGTLRSGRTQVTQTTGTLTPFGSITGASVGACEGGTVTLLTETLPWSIGAVYGTSGGFFDEGTEANTGLLAVILGMNASVRINFFSCLFRSINLNFAYEYSTSAIITGRSPALTNRFTECGGLGTGEVLANFRVSPEQTVRGFPCNIIVEANITETAAPAGGFTRNTPVRIECWFNYRTRIKRIFVTNESRGDISISDNRERMVGNAYNEDGKLYEIIGRANPVGTRTIRERVIIETDRGDFTSRVSW